MLTPGYQEVIDLHLLVSCASRKPQQSVSSAPPSSSSSLHLSTPLLPIRVRESSAPPIAVYTASTLPSYPATPANAGTFLRPVTIVGLVGPLFFYFPCALFPY